MRLQGSSELCGRWKIIVYGWLLCDTVVGRFAEPMEGFGSAGPRFLLAKSSGATVRLHQCELPASNGFRGCRMRVAASYVLQYAGCPRQVASRPLIMTLTECVKQRLCHLATPSSDARKRSGVRTTRLRSVRKLTRRAHGPRSPRRSTS